MRSFVPDGFDPQIANACRPPQQQDKKAEHQQKLSTNFKVVEHLPVFLRIEMRGK